MLIKGSDERERRVQQRKLAGEVNAKIDAVTQDESSKSGRETERKLPPGEMRANILVAQPANAVVEDVSIGGLKISSGAKLEANSHLGIFFKIPGKESGVTLICEVIWHKQWAAGMSHSTGLKILTTTDDKIFTAFVEQLPQLIES